MSAPSTAPTRPTLTASDAARLARERFGVEGEATLLPGDRDRSFRIEGRDGDGRSGRWVLKVAPAEESHEVLDAQNAALRLLPSAAPSRRFPVPRPAVGGGGTTTVTLAGRAHAVRLLDWVEGEPLAGVRPRSPALLEDVGALLGEVQRGLAGFDHPAARRPLRWDLRHGRRVAGEGLDALPTGRRDLVERFLALYDESVAPVADALRTGVIHGDGNDHNVLVEPVPEDPFRPRRAVGLIDFGDLVRSWVVGEAAVAGAYAMLEQPDPLAALAALAAGFHRAWPLDEAEVEALHPLACLRLCVSVTIAAGRRAEAEGDVDPYHLVSEAPAWDALERLAGVHPRLARYVLRDACGLPPVPAAASVAAWLDRTEPAPVLDAPLSAPDVRVLDLGPGSTEVAGLSTEDGPDAWERRISRLVADAGATVGWGRWDEVRRWYTADLFRAPGPDREEWRSVHVGVDLFVEAGTALHAPLPSTVHAVRDNAGALDYGPTVILRHDADGTPFFTLWGHLDPEVLDRLSPGDALAPGDVVARVGAPPRNGGWAPHLHLQVVVDLLDADGEVPGVARPSHRAVWRALSPDPAPLLGLPGIPTGDEGASTEEILETRDRHLGRNLSVSYRRPLKIVHGWRQRLWDHRGQPYLDAVNNVPHVGHSHPRVVRAIARQAAVLNTNTRYLHDLLAEYSERLAATLPDPLSVCVFVCSGSEANELAIRMARAHTGARDVVVVDGGYHGNTSTLVALSPYKYKGPGGGGREPWVHEAAMPDPYRGPHRGPDAGARYAESVEARVADAAERGGVAAFLAEPLIGCGGQVVPPDGWLAGAYRAVREAGGVYIADEVQVGFGRVGSHFWAFETQGVVPDVVTMGKPMGNGHPVAAVVTTPEIAASFDDGMEYFNTFGGNPVSCAAGLAVLDVIRDEGLRENALETGRALLEGLEALKPRHPVVGDVRGRGLYVGVDLVADRESREPVPARVAAYVAERMKDRGVLISTDGPAHNVLKIKPPLCFDGADAAFLVEALDRTLAEDPVRRANPGTPPR